jgi:SPX domain protein involved in polyphosphate accumulation
MNAVLAPSHSLPPVLERYELKYLIPAAYVEPISDFISLYCALDKHAAAAVSNGCFYAVTSLYFDSPSHEFYKQRVNGQAHRVNMRARAYGDGCQPPYFLEIKQRMGIPGVVRKYRATVGDDEWPHLLSDPLFRMGDAAPSKNQLNKEHFLRLALSHAIEPKLLTKYQRRAFFSTVDDYVRVTMDTQMQYRAQTHYSLNSSHGMTHYDNETIYANNTHSDANVVLEIKCNVGEVPQWVLSLVNRFELKQQAFSKYASSTWVAHGDNGDHYMSPDRALPHAVALGLGIGGGLRLPWRNSPAL